MTNTPKGRGFPASSSVTPPLEEWEEEGFIEMIPVDMHVDESAQTPPPLDVWFDERGRFKMPENNKADSWQDAQRFAAMSLDIRDSTFALLRDRLGHPRLWESGAIDVAREVSALSRDAVAMAVFGRSFPLRRWPLVQQIGRLAFDLMDMMREVAKRSSRKNQDERYPEETRAELSMLAALGCKVLLESEVLQQLPRSNPLDHVDERVNVRGAPPLYLQKMVQDVWETASVLAEAGAEPRRGNTQHNDKALWKIAAIAARLLVELQSQSDFDDSKLPAHMRAGALGEQSRTFEYLAESVNGLGTISGEERSGAAFLISAVQVGWGARKPESATFMSLLADVQSGSSAKDEDTTLNYAEFPVLRWRAVINRALNALGHNADDLSDGAVRAAKKAAKKAQKPKSFGKR